MVGEGAIGGKIEKGDGVGILRDPVVEVEVGSVRLLAFGSREGVVGEARGRCEGIALSFGEGVVAVAQVFDEDIEGPAVSNHVVGGEEKDVAGIAHLFQVGSHQRSFFEVERGEGLCFGLQSDGFTFVFF